MSSGCPQGRIPFPPEHHNISLSRPMSLSELTNRFEQHSLRSGPSCRQTPRTNVNLSSRQTRLSCPHGSGISIRQQRQALTRRQCSSTHLSLVAALAESILRDGSSCFASTHPSSLQDSSSSASTSYTPSPALSTVSSSTSLNSISSSPSMWPVEDSEAPLVRTCARPCSTRIRKSPRCRTSREAFINQDLVLKAVRLRRNYPQRESVGSRT